MVSKKALALTICLGLASLSACSRTGSPVAQARGDLTPVANPEATDAATPESVPVAPPPTSFTLDAGIEVPVRLLETLDTRRNRAGDHFTAVLDEPLVSGDRVIVPKGTLFSGHISQASSSGRFKGRAVIGLKLDSFQLNGQSYQVSSTSSARQSGGHKKRNWLWTGGVASGGAAIGALAAGGAGALIGAGAGAAAGTVGAAITGKRHVQLPTETRITFRLRSPIEIAG